MILKHSATRKRNFIKVLLTVLLLSFSFACLYPTFFGKSFFGCSFTKKINLGLDLQGGVQTVLKVRMDQYVADRLKLLKGRIASALRSSSLECKKIEQVGQSIDLHIDEAERHRPTVAKLLQSIDAGLGAEIEGGSKIKLKYKPHALSKISFQVLEQSVEIIRRRVDGMGTKEPIIQIQGQDSILLQVPGFTDAKPLRSLIGKTARLSFHLINAGEALSDVHSGASNPFLTGDLITDSSVQFIDGAPVVCFDLNNVGARIFSNVTRKHKGQHMVISLDGEPISVPLIDDHIPGGKVFICGDLTLDQAQELALLLKSGALPASLDIVEEQTVGPTLGGDSIKSSQKAGLLALVLVIGLMLWQYGALGIIASYALISVLLLIGATLVLFDITLTLPGIAGIILTLGMAVDANILVYEHIRECIKKGLSAPIAAMQGFALSLKTILDANLTSFISAALLYIFGIGAIRGFAVTFGLGIIASMIGCFWITRPLVCMLYTKQPVSG